MRYPEMMLEKGVKDLYHEWLTAGCVSKKKCQVELKGGMALLSIYSIDMLYTIWPQHGIWEVPKAVVFGPVFTPALFSLGMEFGP